MTSDLKAMPCPVCGEMNNVKVEHITDPEKKEAVYKVGFVGEVCDCPVGLAVAVQVQPMDMRGLTPVDMSDFDSVQNFLDKE